MGTKNHPGEFDCYANAAPDEPMFVLLARDPLAPGAVKLWAQTRSMTHGTFDPKALEALDCANAMIEWRKANR